MAVLHILLTILKIAGILLLILLGLLLLGILTFLFCPVRYQAQGRKEGQELEGEVKVSWLFGLLSFRGAYQKGGEGFETSFRLLGLSQERLLRIFSRGKTVFRRRPGKGKRIKKTEEPENRLEPEENKELSQTPETVKALEAPKEENSSEASKGIGEKENPFWGRIRKKGKKMLRILKKLLSFPERIRKAFRKFSLTGRKIYGKIKKVGECLDTEEFHRAGAFAFSEGKRLFLHIRPRKIRGWLRFGMEDPCATGEILAAAGVFYPLYGEAFTIEPYFDRRILEGSLWLKGRIRGIHFVLSAWRFYRNQDVRQVFLRWRGRTKA